MKKVINFISIILCLSILLCSCSASKVNTDKSAMQLSNANADETTKRIYSYICDTYENGIISAQQESTWMGSSEYEMDYIYNTTGKLPAMRGLDFMNDDFDGVVQRSIDWWNKGGLVTICWHCGSDFADSYDECISDEIENWDLILTDGTPENQAFMESMDKAGNALIELQKAGVTVLWRPFHEFDGEWFWWGKGGADHFKKLWVMMYNHFTDDLGLNNLIWVLGYSHNGKNVDKWYPGDEYCDIVGADSYEVSENGAEDRLFGRVKNATQGRKPLCFHECGLIPTEEQLKETPWCSFMAWHTEYLIDANSKEQLSEIYNSDYVITLDELPSFV